MWPVYSHLGEDWLRTDFAEDSAYGELCRNPLNRIENPDLIEVGQRIEIPLHVLLERETYEIGNE